MINIDKEKLAAFEAAMLANGAHDYFGDANNTAACAMEWAAHLAGEPHSDHPQCVSPVIGAFMRSWNDSLSDDKRQLLKPYVIKSLGTKSTPEIEERRSWLAMDWMIRTYLPAWLELAKLTSDADTIRSLPEITSATLTATMPAIKAAQNNSAAARAAAWGAAVDAAGAAAWDAAWGAAWGAAVAAAVAAAGDAAWDAAWGAAVDAAGAAAWGAAVDAAPKSLAPTVERLQTSALELLDRMIECGA